MTIPKYLRKLRELYKLSIINLKKMVSGLIEVENNHNERDK